jgi:L-lactate dehydrogenase (cytochrome)
MSTRSIEEVAAVSNGTKWFQVYTWKDRGVVRELVERSAAAGYEALWLTVDTAVLGKRERDIRRGFTIPPRIGPGTILDGILHPAWTYDFLTHEPLTFANVAHLPVPQGDEQMGRGKYVMQNFDQALAWSDVEWLRSVWSGPIVLKGIQCVDDAVRAVEEGVEAIALSNHGGRQLDGSPAPIELVEPVAQALQGRAAVICDGGVRRGSDVVKALALGAHAVMIGRAYLWGLADNGQAGVENVLDILRMGIDSTLLGLGKSSIKELSSSDVVVPDDFSPPPCDDRPA